MLASESWFPVDEKKGVVTIGLNKPKGFENHHHRHHHYYY